MALYRYILADDGCEETDSLEWESDAQAIGWARTILPIADHARVSVGVVGRQDIRPLGSWSYARVADGAKWMASEEAPS
jgi:hypothetical protein